MPISDLSQNRDKVYMCTTKQHMQILFNSRILHSVFYKVYFDRALFFVFVYAPSYHLHCIHISFRSSNVSPPFLLCPFHKITFVFFQFRLFSSWKKDLVESYKFCNRGQRINNKDYKSQLLLNNIFIPLLSFDYLFEISLD